MASFTGVGDNTELQAGAKGNTVAVAISGTYNMTIALQREVGSPGSGAWQILKSWDTEDATVAYDHITEYDNEKLRLIVLVDTSGTATATLSDNEDRLIERTTDLVGNVQYERTEAGHKFYGSIRRGDAVVSIEADTTLTAEDHAGKLLVLNNAAGDTVTLPAATGTGDVYKFIVGTTVTSNNDIIQVANGTDEFHGSITNVDTDTSDAVACWPALDGDGYDTITMNGSTKGGIMGDVLTVTDYASGKFLIEGRTTGTGTVATPFSAAVS